MMISKASKMIDLRPEFDERLSKHFGFCDSSETHDPFASDEIRPMGAAKAGKNEMLRHMLALKYGFATKLLLEIVHHDEVGPITRPRKDENVGPSQVVHRFPQRATGEKVHVAERT